MDTLTRMRAFIDVVDAEGFSAAARKIGRSKALLSKYIRELEDDLGALLLNRTTRQFSLTETGQLYYKRALEIVNEIDALSQSVRESGGAISGRIKLSASRGFADTPIGQSLIDFAHAYPDTVLDISLDDTLVDLVEEGFDLAIRITQLDDSSLIARRLGSSSTKLCTSPETLEKYGSPNHPAELANLPCIVDTNHRWRNNWTFVDDDGSDLIVPVKGPIEVNSPLAAKAAILSGLGFSMIPEFAVAEELKDGRLVCLLDSYIPNTIEIFAVYPHRRYLPAKVRTLVDYLVAWFKEYEKQK